MNYEELLVFISNNGRYLEYVINQNLEICEAAVKNDPSALYHAKVQTEEMCIDAIKRSRVGQCLSVFFSVIEKTPKICMLAISKDPIYSLNYIVNQTEEMCMAAVKNNGIALRYVKDKTDELCLVAVKNNWRALEYVDNKTEKICLIAVDIHGMALNYVNNKTKKICIHALINSKNCYKYLPKYYHKYGKTYMYKWAKSQIAFENGNGLNIYNNDFDIKFSYGH